MGISGKTALDQSKADAEEEIGAIDRPAQECSGWIGLDANYDDLWLTPVSDCRVRIEVEGAEVANGPRTQSLATFAKEDGQPHPTERPDLGVYRQSGVASGSAVVALVPDGDASVESLTEQIYDALAAFEQSMLTRLKPWIDDWKERGWLSVPAARRDGQLRGLAAWWEGELDFWASVSDVAQSAWGAIEAGAQKLAGWYDNLPWYEQAFPPLAVTREAAEAIRALWSGIVDLWNRREDLMRLLKAFSTGTVAAIEAALQRLVDLPGELGALMTALVKHSADWVQNMIEVARNTDVFKRTVNTIMTVVMMMTPNFWSEGIGMVEGYLMPEVLITIILLLVGALCAAAGASTLAARVTGYLAKLRRAISAAGKIGELFTSFFSKIDDIAELIGRLSKALRRRIEEVAEGITEKLNKIFRRSSRVWTVDDFITPHAYERHRYDPTRPSTRSKTQYGRDVDPKIVRERTMKRPDDVEKLYDEHGNHYATKYFKTFEENLSTDATPTRESRVFVNHVNPERSTQFPHYKPGGQ